MEDDCKLTEEEIKIMRDHDNAIIEDIEKQAKKDQKVLDSIKKEVPDSFYKKIIEELEESEGGRNLEIVDEPYGDNQDYEDREVWVDQWSVGESGDSWAGEVYMKLPNGKWLKWGYEC